MGSFLNYLNQIQQGDFWELEIEMGNEAEIQDRMRSNYNTESSSPASTLVVFDSDVDGIKLSKFASLWLYDAQHFKAFMPELYSSTSAVKTFAFLMQTAVFRRPDRPKIKHMENFSTVDEVDHSISCKVLTDFRFCNRTESITFPLLTEESF